MKSCTREGSRAPGLLTSQTKVGAAPRGMGEQRAGGWSAPGLTGSLLLFPPGFSPLGCKELKGQIGHWSSWGAWVLNSPAAARAWGWGPVHQVFLPTGIVSVISVWKQMLILEPASGYVSGWTSSLGSQTQTTRLKVDILLYLRNFLIHDVCGFISFCMRTRAS